MTDALAELGRDIRVRRRELDQRMGEARAMVVYFKELKEQILELTDNVVNHERATILLNSIGEDKQFAAQEAIEALVTRGLQTIFDDSLSFHIRQKVSGKRAEVDFVVRSKLSGGRTVETDVMDARGGGLAAVIGFLLRLVVMLLRTSTKEDNVLVLDETFAHVSAEYLPALGEFLRKVVDKTGVQIIMVTHQQEFVEFADMVYHLSTEDGKTVVRQDA